MTPNPVQPEWIQYGSFGLIAFLVIVGLPGGLWWLRNAILTAFEYHKSIVADLTKTFKEESEFCREEREKQACRADLNSEKDRSSRHELANSLQILNGNVQLLINRGNHMPS